MSFQWTLVSIFLYAEVLWVVVLLLPVLSATKWKQFFNSQLVRHIQPKANFYFNIFLTILCVFLLDAIRETIKYQESNEVVKPPNTGPVATHMSGPEAVHEFRAQRNLYITSMALFLWFVIKRLVVLISASADLIETCSMQARQIEVIRGEMNEILDARVMSKMQKDPNAGEVMDDVGATETMKEPLRERSRSRVKKEM